MTNNWSVRELKRALDSLLYERTGLSTDKATVLVDLKLGAFSHADAGQMNVYLNYYREQEMTPGYNPPVGLILCAQKNDTLVRYATSGLREQLFVRKYQVNLPTEVELQQLIQAEQQRFQL